MKVLVTGATGFVGLNAVHRLIEAGHDPVALVRRTSPVERLPEGVETVRGDITDDESVDGAVSDVEAVFHFAAVHSMYKGTIEDRNFVDWERMKSVNVDGTENLVLAAEKHDVETFVFTSTYRAHPDVSTGDSDDYVRSKTMAAELFQKHDISCDHTILYATTIMGPRDYRLNKFGHFWWVRANRILIPPLFSPGGRNIVHVDDVVDAAMYALTDDPEPHQLVTGTNFDGKGLHSAIARTMESHCWVIPIPFSVLKYLVAPMVDFLHGRGLIHLKGEEFIIRSDSAVPGEHENVGPGESRPPRRIFEDMHEWYVEVGLL